MQNGRMSTRRPRPVGSLTARPKATNTSAARSVLTGFKAPKEAMSDISR